METTLVKHQTSKRPSPDTTSSDKHELISEWVVRFALNADKPLNAKEQAIICSTWEEGFSDVDPNRLKAAFVACLRSHTFKTVPTIGDVRKHLQKAESNAAEEEASQKFQKVLDYAVRLSPDIPDRNPPRISERVLCAIRAAGGLSYLRNCSAESLEWARKRFIEAYLRYGEMQQEQALLPDGEFKNLLAGVSRTKELPAPKQNWTDLHNRGVEYGEEARLIVEKKTTQSEPAKPAPIREEPRFMDTESRRAELLRQAEFVKAKYSQTEATL